MCLTPADPVLGSKHEFLAGANWELANLESSNSPCPWRVPLAKAQDKVISYRKQLLFLSAPQHPFTLLFIGASSTKPTRTRDNIILAGSWIIFNSIRTRHKSRQALETNAISGKLLIGNRALLTCRSGWQDRSCRRRLAPSTAQNSCPGCEGG